MSNSDFSLLVRQNSWSHRWKSCYPNINAVNHCPQVGFAFREGKPNIYNRITSYTFSVSKFKRESLNVQYLEVEIGLHFLLEQKSIGHV